VGDLCAALRATRVALEELRDGAERTRRGAWSAAQDRAAAQAEEEARRIGWCLGVLGAADGHDCLRARREPHGLRWMVEAVALARGRVLAPGGARLPAPPAAGNAWEAALLGGWCAAESMRGTSGAVRWRALDGAGIAFPLPRPGAELVTRVARLGSAPGMAVRLERGELELRWS